MSAVDVIKDLIKLGTVIANAAKSSTTGGKFDFVTFLKSTAPADIVNDVDNIMNELKPNDLQDAIGKVVQKENDLLGGRKLTQLSVDEAVQYSALVDTELLLQTAVLKRAIEGDFYGWLLNDGLPDLVVIAKVVIPLLV